MQRAFIVISYAAFYLISFTLLEHRKATYHMLSSFLDGYIPFCKYFIIPYFAWFVFMIAALAYFTLFCEDQIEFCQFSGVLGMGLTVFLLISFLYPNAQQLRPVLEGNDILTQAVALLYRIDTPTNILPSMHVFCSVACCYAIVKHSRFQTNRLLKAGTIMLTVCIVLSTLFLKQHSTVDVAAALMLNIICCLIFYKIPLWKSNDIPRLNRFCPSMRKRMISLCPSEHKSSQNGSHIE